MPGVSSPGTDSVGAPPTEESAAPVGSAPVTIQHVRDAWPEILEKVQRVGRNAWAIAYTAHPRALHGDVLTLVFVSRADVEVFRGVGQPNGVSEILRTAIVDVLGIRVKYLPKVDAAVADEDDAEPPGPPAELPHAMVPQPIPEHERYGESVVREILGASFLEETALPQHES